LPAPLFCSYSARDRRGVMHQQPPQAPRAPNRRSKSPQRSGTRGTICSAGRGLDGMANPPAEPAARYHLTIRTSRPLEATRRVGSASASQSRPGVSRANPRGPGRGGSAPSRASRTRAAPPSPGASCARGMTAPFPCRPFETDS
jgi:hypothetical protein